MAHDGSHDVQLGVLTRTFTSLALSLFVAASMAGCQSEPEPKHLRQYSIYTHCGVGQIEIGGVTYYPMSIYANGELVAGGGEVRVGAGGPTPWIDTDGVTSGYPEGVADLNYTFGTIYVPGDGTAEFAVADGIHTVTFSNDRDDAAWIVEGCS